MTRPAPYAAMLALAIGALAVAGCGSSSKSTSTAAPAPAPATTASTAVSTPAPASGTASSTLKLAASPEGVLKFDQSTLTAKAGTVSIDFTNNAPVSHNLTIESSGTVLGSTPTFAGGSKKLSVSLKPGVYKFYCSVPGHRQAGMEGTLTVK